MKIVTVEINCDICKCDIDESILSPKFIEFDTEPIVVANIKTKKDICIYCFMKAVKKLDPKTKAAN